MHMRMEPESDQDCQGSHEDPSFSEDPIRNTPENETSSGRTESAEPLTNQSQSDQPQPAENEIDPMIIPDSVRGAPEELKPAIRKKQNKESARRSRRRRKELVMNLGQSIDMLVQKTQELESRLESIEQFLAPKLGYEASTQSRLGYPGLNRGTSLSLSDGGASHSGSIGMGGSDGGSQSRSGAPTNAAQQRVSERARRSAQFDEEVEKLINSCLNQL